MYCESIPVQCECIAMCQGGGEIVQNFRGENQGDDYKHLQMLLALRNMNKEIKCSVVNE